MAKVKLLTKQDLVEVLGQFETRLDKKFATKDDIRQVVGDEIASRGLTTKNDFASMEARLSKELKDYVHQGVDTVVAALDDTSKEINHRLDKVEQEQKITNRRLLGLEHDTVGKKEFTELKGRVDINFPLN